MHALTLIFTVFIFLFPATIVWAAEDVAYPLSTFSWHDENGELNVKGAALVEILQASADHGLRPEDYGINQNIAFTDETLTKSALQYTRDLSVGRKTPQEIDPELYIYPRNIETGTVLATAYNSRDIAATFEKLAPNYHEYRLLKNKLALFRALEEQGGWPKVQNTETLNPGDQNKAVGDLKERLAAQGYFKLDNSDAFLFDERLKESVENFQRHHGLEPDGVVGPKTFAALNISVSDRIKQIIMNMERWRWLPDDLGDRHIRVNIAGFDLKVFEDNDLAMEMPVIVGKNYRKTPIFSTVMTDVIFNPYWHVPVKIAFSNVIPEIIKNPDYLERQGFDVLRYDEDGQLRSVKNPKSLQWAEFTRGNFPYLLRQRPGVKNALGHIRFSIKNDMSIYMHGTPDQGIFSEVNRARSSGCIRVAEPLQLLKYVLRGHPSWGNTKIENTYFQHEETDDLKPQTVPLSEQIPVHILYWTAWAEDDNHIYFQDDIYGRDKILEKALF